MLPFLVELSNELYFCFWFTWNYTHLPALETFFQLGKGSKHRNDSPLDVTPITNHLSVKDCIFCRFLFFFKNAACDSWCEGACLVVVIKGAQISKTFPSKDVLMPDYSSYWRVILAKYFQTYASSIENQAWIEFSWCLYKFTLTA